MKPVEKAAVIDVGSNSCRMVIYERWGNGLLPYFNEKSMAGLGRGLPETGHLSPEGRIKAIETFHRFSAILKGLGVHNVNAVATSAVREASDGPEFRELAEAALGVELKVLSGVDEGRLSAYGVGLGFSNPDGLVADLGGSSMELYALGELAAKGETYLLGPLARAADTELSPSKRQKIVRKIVKDSALLGQHHSHLYAVGGAWRNVAAVHMMLKNYPLRVVHSYKLDADAIDDVIDAALRAEEDAEMRQKLVSVSKKRFDTLLHSAIVLKGLLVACDAESAIISSYGLRDGVVGEAFQVQSEGGLLDSVPLYLRASEATVAFGREVYDFIAPLKFALSRSDETLRATCLMSDAGARMHPDHRANLVHRQILRVPVPELDHNARLFAAFAAASRYTFKLKAPSEIVALMSEPMISEARILGTAMRLAGVYSGRSAAILKTARLSANDKALTLHVTRKNSDLVSGTVRRRHAQLCGLLNLEPNFELV